jgi:hypothetical protein
MFIHNVRVREGSFYTWVRVALMVLTSTKSETYSCLFCTSGGHFGFSFVFEFSTMKIQAYVFRLDIIMACREGTRRQRSCL